MKKAKMGKACPCVARKKGAFIAGLFNSILGLLMIVGIMALFCMHYPEDLWKIYEDGLLKRQSLGRILIFYIAPGVGTLALGVLLCLATKHDDRLVMHAAFVVSTIHVCGSGIEVVFMRLYGAPWITVVPLILIFLSQVYIFAVAADYRDHSLNHGRLVKSNTDRRRLQEEPVANEDSELSQINPNPPSDIQV